MTIFHVFYYSFVLCLSFLLAMRHLEDEIYKVEEARRKEEKNLEMLMDKIKMAMVKQSHLKK